MAAIVDFGSALTDVQEHARCNRYYSIQAIMRRLYSKFKISNATLILIQSSKAAVRAGVVAAVKNAAGESSFAAAAATTSSLPKIKLPIPCRGFAGMMTVSK